MQSLAGQGSTGHDRLRFRAVDDFPTFANRGAGGKGSTQYFFKGPPPPDTLLIKRLETKDFLQDRHEFYVKSVVPGFTFDHPVL